VTLIIWVVLLAGLGVIASLLPARRAARLDILRAIGAE
jgi:ABC-type antimicrobial peptide transport system permease subunit